MNEELQNKLVESVDWLQKSLENGANIAAVEVPLFIQEYLSWIFWKNIIYFSLTSTLFISAVLILKYSFTTKFKVEWDQYGEAKNEKDELNFLFKIVSIVAALISTIAWFLVALPSIMTSLQCIIAPKVLLLEHAAALISK